MKILAIITALGVTAIIAFFALNQHIYNQKQQPNIAEAYQAELSGTYVCLPHKYTDGTQTDECAAGIQTQNDEYYALDLALLSQGAPELSIGDNISANGTITPIELLSTNHWQQYNIEGIFSVTDSLQIN